MSAVASWFQDKVTLGGTGLVTVTFSGGPGQSMVEWPGMAKQHTYRCAIPNIFTKNDFA